MIYINARFLTQNITGVQRFAIELSKALLGFKDDIVFLVPNLSNINDQSVLNHLNIVEVNGGYGHYWEQVALPKYLKSLGSPLLINLCNTAPILYKNKISTIHDITFLRYPQSYSWSFRTAYRILIPLILRSSKKILTVSEFSKQDIFQYYHLSQDKVDVVYNAVSSIFQQDFYFNNQKSNYALTVSSPNLHKNFSAMIQAFKQTNIDLELKIIGSLSDSFQNLNYDVSQNEKIQFVGRVGDDELAKLYQHAKFFIFPSLYEGFGIPPLEAQACGCPVVSSNAASLPEVLGESAYFFDPKNLEDMECAFIKMMNDDILRNNLIEKGNKNVQRFSWNESAKKLNKIIDKII